MLQANGAVFAANPTPLPPPPGAFGVEWLMGHVVDVISAGPLYDGKLSPVWAQMVRLYAQYLGVIPKRAASAPDERSPNRRALEKELKALIPAIADLIEAEERADQDEEEVEDESEEAEELEEESPPPSPEDQAKAEAYELFPITRLEDDEVMAEALGRKPKPESLQRALKLALDGCEQRARILRGPLAEISPKAVRLADRLARRWDALFIDPKLIERLERPPYDEMDADLFETAAQKFRRMYFPPSGSPPN